MPKAPLQSYMFTIGDSYPGPIAMSFRVAARSEEEAVDRARAILEVFEVELTRQLMPDRGPDEYVVLHLNASAVTAANIEECDELIEEDLEGFDGWDDSEE